MNTDAENIGETVRAEFISWIEANPVDAALLLSESICQGPVVTIGVADLIALGRHLGMKGLPEIDEEDLPEIDDEEQRQWAETLGI